MPSDRYTSASTALPSAIERRAAACPWRPVAIGLLGVLALGGFAVAWKATNDVQSLCASHRALEIETANYRAAIDALTGQISTLQSTARDRAKSEGTPSPHRPTLYTLVASASTIRSRPPASRTAPISPANGDGRRAGDVESSERRAPCAVP